MKCGVVDIGSNTVQLTVYRYEGDSFRPLLNRWETVGLAGYVENGALTEEGVRAACRVLKDFQTPLEDLEIPELHAFATASLRGISNSEQVLETIRAHTGVRVELLSGEEEAEYSFRGATWGVPSPAGLMADIGGGSTELVGYEDGVITSTVSLNVGVVSLFTKFVSGVLPTQAEQGAIRAHAAALLDTQTLSRSRSLLGVGGSVRAIVRLCNTLSGAEPENRVVSPREVNSLYNRLSKGDRDALRLILRAAPDRVHTVMPGLILAQEILGRCGAESLTMSATGVREGYLLSRVMGR
jgi:exopolyphosphatase/guanosine-5'-triphosphate,3'-diphosphate pyrophosphatase